MYDYVIAACLKAYGKIIIYVRSYDDRLGKLQPKVVCRNHISRVLNAALKLCGDFLIFFVWFCAEGVYVFVILAEDN